MEVAPATQGEPSMVGIWVGEGGDARKEK